MDEHTSEISMDLRKGYKFLVDFHEKGVEPLLVDEPPPLGEGMARAPRSCSPPPSATA